MCGIGRDKLSLGFDSRSLPPAVARYRWCHRRRRRCLSAASPHATSATPRHPPPPPPPSRRHGVAAAVPAGPQRGRVVSPRRPSGAHFVHQPVRGGRLPVLAGGAAAAAPVRRGRLLVPRDAPLLLPAGPRRTVDVERRIRRSVNASYHIFTITYPGGNVKICAIYFYFFSPICPSSICRPTIHQQFTYNLLSPTATCWNNHGLWFSDSVYCYSGWGLCTVTVTEVCVLLQWLRPVYCYSDWGLCTVTVTEVCVLLQWLRPVYCYSGWGLCTVTVAEACVLLQWLRPVYCYSGWGLCTVTVTEVCVLLQWQRSVYCYSDRGLCSVTVTEVCVLLQWLRPVNCYSGWGLCTVTVAKVCVLLQWQRSGYCYSDRSVYCYSDWGLCTVTVAEACVLLQWLRSVHCYSGWGLCTVTVAEACVLLQWLRSVHCYSGWGLWTVAVADVGEDISAYADEECLLLVNHQSTGDVPVIMTCLQDKGDVSGSVLWVIDSLFRYTHFGICSTMRGDYFISTVSNLSCSLGAN